MKEEEKAVAFYKEVRDSGSQGSVATVLVSVMSEIMEKTNATESSLEVENKFGTYKVTIEKIHD